MFKKIFSLVLAAFIFFPVSTYAYHVDQDGHTDAGPMQRMGIVMKRGLVNIATMPLELKRSFTIQRDEHKWIWPATFPFYFMTNFFCRATSGFADVAFHPLMAPFTDDITPWTEPMGLTEYAWQIEK